jgi:hypothetical protein
MRKGFGKMLIDFSKCYVCSNIEDVVLLPAFQWTVKLYFNIFTVRLSKYNFTGAELYLNVDEKNRS